MRLRFKCDEKYTLVNKYKELFWIKIAIDDELSDEDNGEANQKSLKEFVVSAISLNAIIETTTLHIMRLTNKIKRQQITILIE